MFDSVWLPLEISRYPYPMYRHNKNDGHEDASYEPEAHAEILMAVDTVLLRNMQIQLDTSEYEQAWATGMSFGPVDAGGISDPLTETYKTKDGVVFPDFERRKAEGEIMVSDYTRIELRVDHYPGLKFDDVQKGRIVDLRWHAMVDAGVCEYVYVSGSSGRKNMRFPSGLRVNASLDDSVARYARSNLFKGSWVLPPVISPREIADQLLSHKPDPKALVTTVTANANTSSLDLLTSMAEMPQAVKSIIAALKQVVTMIKDAKRGEFLIKNRFGARKRDLNLHFHRDIKRLKTGLKDPNLSPARKLALQKRLDELNEKYSRSMLSHADELTSALADLWLNFRYNIMPNVYMAQDVYEAVERYRTEYITSRGFQVDSPEILVHGMESFTLQTKTSVMIRRNFSADSAAWGTSVISNDIFVTAWEVFPWSFVIDWFINIGDVLSSMSYNPSWAQEGATLATSVEDINLELKPKTPYAGFHIEPRTVVSGFIYERQVIDPTSLCGLVWKPSVGLARQVDALALLWRPARSQFIKLKNR